MITSILLQSMCRPLFCPVGEFLNGCRCQQPMKVLAGLPVQLTLKIVPETHPKISADFVLSRLHVAVKKSLNKVASHVSTDIIATYKQETMSKDYYITAVRIRSKFGHDTKLTMKPFLRYHDSGEKLYIQIMKVKHCLELTSSVRCWLDRVTGTYGCKDHSLPTKTPTLLYLDESLLPRGMLNLYQVLSPLIYCLQVELESEEFVQNDGIVTINITSPPLTVYDYYRVSRTMSAPIRICADVYLSNRNHAYFNVQTFKQVWLGLLFTALAGKY